MVSSKLRVIFRRIHLRIALVFGAFFTLSGITGSAIAWMHELDSFLNPDLFLVAGAHRPALGAAQLAERIVAHLSADPAYGRPSSLVLPQHADEVAIAWYRPPAGSQASLFAVEQARQVMIDPYSLQVTGERIWGEAGVSRRLLMPTLFHVHRYLLAGEAGKTVIGISGLALLLTSLMGIVLWWPKASLGALRKALTISYRGSWPRLNYSFHRAAGFFAAPVLALLGFSGLYFNLPQWVVPVVGSVAAVSPTDKLSSEDAQSRAHIPVAQAVQVAQEIFPAARVSRIALPAKATAPYEIRVRQPNEVRKGDGSTRITIDAYSGKVLLVRDPLRAPSGDRFLDWLFPLHSGEAFGNAGRVLISTTGGILLTFLVTGVAIWLRRKR